MCIFTYLEYIWSLKWKNICEKDLSYWKHNHGLKNMEGKKVQDIAQTEWFI